MTRWYLMVFLLTMIFHSAFTLAQDTCDQDCILGRLADLEMKQRASDAENHELREIISQQQSTLESQARRIDALEDTVTAMQQAAAPHEDTEQPTTQQHTQGHVLSKNGTQDAAPDSKGISVAPTAVDDDITRTWPRRSVDSNRDNVFTPQTKRQERSGIAFSTYLDHNVEVSSQQTIKFNKIITNEGNGFNNHTGVFTCPEAGMYLLTYVIGERDARQQRVKMMINSANLVDAAVDTFHATQDLQGGNTAIVRLSVGDAVWLESGSLNGHVEGATGNGRFSTFSGVFLYA